MSLIVVGSIALDTLTTPAGKVEDTLGGSAVYFSLVANQLTKVRIVGVVGPDFPVQEKRFLESKGVDLQGLTTAQGPTFRWEGVYGQDYGDARTIRTELGVFAKFSPRIPDSYRDTPYVFLANIDPTLQLEVLDQVQSPSWIAVDTMNLWIDRQKDRLLEVLRRVDVVLLNEAEAKQLARRNSLFSAGRYVLDQGPRYVVVKRGSCGVILFGGPRPFQLPAVPLDTVVDPTGAGDSFAAGMLGYLASVNSELDFESVRKSLAYGTVTASFAVGGFGVQKLRGLERSHVDGELSRFLSTCQLGEVWQ
ncbi:sugar kinase [Candidatus Fermentibacteria bacterium]|nr:sugar kinase [Candidatus Fermentibacteria bacterium]